MKHDPRDWDGYNDGREEPDPDGVCATCGTDVYEHADDQGASLGLYCGTCAAYVAAAERCETCDEALPRCSCAAEASHVGAYCAGLPGASPRVITAEMRAEREASLARYRAERSPAPCRECAEDFEHHPDEPQVCPGCRAVFYS